MFKAVHAPATRRQGKQCLGVATPEWELRALLSHSMFDVPWMQSLGRHHCFIPSQSASSRCAPAPFIITISKHLYSPQGGGQDGFSNRNGGDTADSEGKPCAETVGQALPTFELGTQDLHPETNKLMSPNALH